MLLRANWTDLVAKRSHDANIVVAQGKPAR